MANVCGRCERPMSSHDNHASCPQCRIAAGECNVDVHNPCSICRVWTSKLWGKLRRSLADARARASQRGKEHWTAAFPQLEVWITSRPASASSSGPASEISSLVSGDDFGDNLLVSTPSPLVQQVLVVQTQNGAKMASGMATTAPSTATTAPSTAPLPLTAGPSTMEPIVPIVVQIEAQDTPSVASVPTIDVASNCVDNPPGPEDQSEGEIIDSEGDPADAGIPILDNLKLSEEEQRDFDDFSLASVSVNKRPWRAQEDSKVSKPQPQDISFTSQARPGTSQAAAKA